MTNSVTTNDAPPARLTIRPSTPADRPVLERLWLLFRHDMSEVSGALPDPSGQFRRERLDAAFTEPAWRGMLAHLEPADGAPASPVGFALVRGLDGPDRVLSSFFVVRGARRTGIGHSSRRRSWRASRAAGRSRSRTPTRRPCTSGGR
ncbi:hypothetical protein [Promicromonospora soli]